jgi:fructokinase
MIGANAIAGEWGHNPLPAPGDDERPGETCYCGRSGCIETFLCGPALSRQYARLGGADLDAQAIAARAAAGEPLARACVSRYEERLARGLAAVINLLDPDVVVLGGGLSNIDSLYARVPVLWAPHVFSDTVATRLAPAAHGDASGVRGAAWLWER